MIILNKGIKIDMADVLCGKSEADPEGAGGIH